MTSDEHDHDHDHTKPPSELELREGRSGACILIAGGVREHPSRAAGRTGVCGMSASPHAWKDPAWGAHNGQFRVTSGHLGAVTLNHRRTGAGTATAIDSTSLAPSRIKEQYGKLDILIN